MTMRRRIVRSPGNSRAASSVNYLSNIGYYPVREIAFKMLRRGFSCSGRTFSKRGAGRSMKHFGNTSRSGMNRIELSSLRRQSAAR
jgi:hypothetical protein